MPPRPNRTSRCLVALLIVFGVVLLHPYLASSRSLLQAPAEGPVNNNPLKDLAGEFVEIHDGEFTVGCRTWKPSGFNQWEVMESGAGTPYLLGASLPNLTTGPELLRSVMDLAVRDGLSFMRAWAHGVHPETALQTTGPGVYNEAIFQGMDYALDEARKRGLKVIIVFGTHWLQIGGVPQYAQWAGLTNNNEFYTNERAITLYKNHVRTVLNRVNTINGIAYKDDPTVFAWNIINEPRCQRCPPNAIKTFVDDMAAFIKGIDKKHLLTVGEEGFYLAGANAAANPQAGRATWPQEQGQDFVLDHSSPNIDFAAFHLWPDNWEDLTEEFVRRWIRQHAQDGVTLRKPVLLQEYGKFPAQREQYYAWILDEVTKQVQAGSPLKGAGMWQIFMPGQIGPESEGGGAGKYGVYPTDAAWNTVVTFTATMNRLFGAPGSGCDSPRNPAVQFPAACPAVRGLPGTGFEGPRCNLDINECVRGTNDCPTNAACTNSVGGFNCTCYPGYSGASCTRDARAVQAFTAGYFTERGKINCRGGVPITWPALGRGFAYDPAGVYAFFGNATSPSCAPLPVSLEDCQAACSLIPNCTGFSANLVQRKCCLTSGTCRADNTCNAPIITCNSTNDLGQVFEQECGAWESYYSANAEDDGCGAPTAPRAAAPAAAVAGRKRKY